MSEGSFSTYSTEYVRKKVLRQTDAEIIEIDMQIEDDIAKGILPDPNAPVDEFGNPLPTPPPTDATGQAVSLGNVPTDPQPDGSIAQAPEQ